MARRKPQTVLPAPDGAPRTWPGLARRRADVPHPSSEQNWHRARLRHHQPVPRGPAFDRFAPAWQTKPGVQPGEPPNQAGTPTQLQERPALPPLTKGWDAWLGPPTARPPHSQQPTPRQEPGEPTTLRDALASLCPTASLRGGTRPDAAPPRPRSAGAQLPGPRQAISPCRPLSVVQAISCRYPPRRLDEFRPGMAQPGPDRVGRTSHHYGDFVHTQSLNLEEDEDHPFLG